MMPVIRVFCFLLLLALSGPLFAQSDNPRGGHFGLKVGGAITSLQLSGATINIPKRKLDPLVGVMYRYRYNRYVIQPEVLFNIRGGTFQQIVVGETNRKTIKGNYQYVSVPVLFGYIPTEGLTVQAGPEFSYALNARLPDQSGRATDYRKPGAQTDIGLAVGVHYDFLDRLDKFSLHLRYIYGFNNVSPEPSATYYNRVFQVGMVYNLYPKNKKK